MCRVLLCICRFFTPEHHDWMITIMMLDLLKSLYLLILMTAMDIDDSNVHGDTLVCGGLFGDTFDDTFGGIFYDTFVCGGLFGLC